MAVSAVWPSLDIAKGVTAVEEAWGEGGGRGGRRLAWVTVEGVALLGHPVYKDTGSERRILTTFFMILLQGVLNSVSRDSRRSK